MIVSIAYSTSFKYNLSQYRSKIAAEKSLKQDQFIEKPKDYSFSTNQQKFDKSELFLDYGPNTEIKPKFDKFSKSELFLDYGPDTEIKPKFDKFSKSELFLDYGPDTEIKPKFDKSVLDYDYEEIKTDEPIAPINFPKIQRILVQKPDLTKDIQEARCKVNEEIKNHAQIFAKEKLVADLVALKQQVVTKLIERLDLRNTEQETCVKEKSHLIECLNSQSDCGDFIKVWRACQEIKK